MVNQLIESAALIPSVILQAFACMRIFAVRREAPLWAWFIGVSLLFGFARSLFGEDVRVVLSFLMPVALYLPFAVSSTRPSVAVRAALLFGVIICSAVSEAVTTLILLLCLGGEPVSPEVFSSSSPLVLSLRLVHLLVLALLLWALYRWAQRGDADRTRSGLWPFVGFPAVQAVLLVLLVSIGLFTGEGWGRDAGFQTAFYGGFVALCALCVVVDVAYLRLVDRLARAKRERLRIEALKSAIDRELARAKRVAYDLEEAAQLRHDLANHIVVARELVCRGDSDAAREHVGEMLRIVREGVDACVGGGASGAARAEAAAADPATAAHPEDGGAALR